MLVMEKEQEKEVWRDVPGYEGKYQVSNTGIVRSLDRIVLYSDGRKRLYKGIIIDGHNRDGYREVSFSKDGKSRLYKVSQVVAMAFLEHIPNGNTLVVDHIDGDKSNDNVDNLRIVTTRENLSTCFRKNRDSFTSKYVGVSYHKNNQNWVGRIRYNGMKIHLGCFDSEIKASEAYQKALGEIKNNSFNPEDYKVYKRNK